MLTNNEVIVFDILTFINVIDKNDGLKYNCAGGGTMPRKLSDAAKAHAIDYNNAYNAKKYDRVTIMPPAGTRAIIKAHAAARGESVNAFINRAIAEQLQRDSLGASADPEAVPGVND